LHNAKLALINRDDGAVATQMFAATAGFGVPHDALSTFPQAEVSIVSEGRQTTPLWNDKSLLA
jgi:hypothetical protein